MKECEAQLLAFYDTLILRTTLLQDSRREMNSYLALDFNLFSYIDPDEGRLSDLIAELLSVEAEHGQRDAFLRCFMEQIGVAHWLANGQTTVRREVPITYPPASYGFMDILIDGGSFAIGIENKPWASEQPDQLDRYRTHLDHEYSGRYCLVYLTGSGMQPTSLPAEIRRKLSAANRFGVLSYRSGLTKWIRACEKECKAEKIRWLLRDFDAFLSSTFASDDYGVGHAPGGN